MSTPDGISVVVPTLGRIDLVELLLRSCAAAGQRYDRPWEVIVVDSSAPATAHRIAELCTQFGARFVTGPWRAGAKRNVGAALAGYDLVLFIDSDCAAEPDLFREHARAHDRAGEAVVAVAGLTCMTGETGLLWRILSRSREHNIPFSWPRYFSVMQWATTSNLSVRRDAFRRIGGFDEQAWTVTGGEDVDLGVRLCRAGGQLVSCDTAVVQHARSEVSNPFQVMRKLNRHGAADVWLCTKFPEHTDLRANPIVMMAGSVALGSCLAALTRRPGPLLLTGLVPPLVWIATLLGRLRRWTGPDRHLEPLAVLIDWALDAGIARAAIRNRRPGLAIRRFRYYSPEHFILKPGLTRVPDPVFHAYGAAGSSDGGPLR